MLAEQSADEVGRVHVIVACLPRHDWRFDERDLPPNGIYLMFERGEDFRTGAAVLPRIVRVASHRKAGRLIDRIRANYGNPYSGSHPHQPPLRAHYRKALLRSLGRDADEDRADARFEERVTAEIRERFTFTVIPIQDADERFEMERALIGLLAQYPPCAPSEEWMGAWADPPIAQSGLWNMKHLNARPLDSGQLARMETLLGEAGYAPSPEPPSGATLFPVDAGLRVGELPLRTSSPHAEENRRIAESLLLGGLTWLRATYPDHDFVTRRDIVWTLHKRLRTVARRTLSGFEVHSAVRNPQERGRPLDLAITDGRGTMLLAANVLYEPDRARLDRDLRYGALPYTSWDEVRHECVRARRMVGAGVAETVCTVLIDEGGRYTSRPVADASQEEWHVQEYPSLCVTYFAERAR